MDGVLVASLQGEVVGSISLHVLPVFHAAGFLGRITNLVVDEHNRGYGIGTALIANVYRWFKTVGCVKQNERIWVLDEIRCIRVGNAVTVKSTFLSDGIQERLPAIAM